MNMLMERPRRKVSKEATRVIARRLEAGRRAGAAQGRPPGGVVPYGYVRAYDVSTGRPEWKMHPATAPVVRRIFREYLRLRSLGKVARQLDLDGVPSAAGRRWSRATLAFVIRNEAYRGIVRYGSVRARGMHPPIVSPIVFNLAQKVARENRKR